MKKSLLVVGAVLASAACVLAQGTINYTTRDVGVLVAPVYLGAAGEASKSGNTMAGFPMGAQTYAGPLLTGSGFSAELFYLSTPNIGTIQPEGSLVGAVGSITTFRTAASLAGTIAPSFQTLPGTTVGGFVTLQLRAWDNKGGTLLDWAAASAPGANTATGKSVIFNVGGLVDNLNPTPPDMVGLLSFNITAVPEPSTFLLGGLGAAAVLIFRRRK